MQKNVDVQNTRLPSGSASQIRNLLDALPFGVQLIDSEHKIVTVNKTLKQHLGMDETQLIGAHCSTVIHKLNAPIEDCPLEEALKKGGTIERELFDSTNARWINASVFPTSIVTSDGMPLFVHFIRDITDAKNTSIELSKSLEHHKALCNLLQNLQHCRNCVQIMDTLIDEVLSLSWLSMAATAVGFLMEGESLELVSHRNVSPDLLSRCRHLELGECLCGKAAQDGYPVICSSDSHNHSIKYKGMNRHGHAVLPVRHKGNTIGVLTLYLNHGDKMDDFRLGFLQAATAAAAAALDGQLAREQAQEAKDKCLAHIISSQEDERKRVAGDLHDNFCQSLSAILLEFQSGCNQEKPSMSDRLRIESHLRELIDQVRQIAGQLRPAILDDFGLESALARKIEEISSLKSTQIDFQCVHSASGQHRLPTTIEAGLYRVAMEALLNAVSHSGASRISVVLFTQNNKVTLLIEDNGCGFDHKTVRKNIDRCEGLIEMEERMGILGGKLGIETSPQNGTTVRAEVPIDSARRTE